MRLLRAKDMRGNSATGVSQRTSIYPIPVEKIRKSEYPLLEGLYPPMRTKARSNANNLQKPHTSIMQEQRRSLDPL